MAVFMKPFTKFGFERIFGQENHKRILVNFLNDVFEGKYHIDNVNYRDSAAIQGPEREQRVIHSVLCAFDDGTPIILEWQTKDIVENFMNRVHYFQGAAINAQIRTVNNWEHIPLYVYILDFVREELDDQFRVDHAIGMKLVSGIPDEHDKMFSDEMERMAFFQLPKFTKTQAECITAIDRWIYILKNMQDLEVIPWSDENEVFAELAQVARLDALTPEELRAYEASEAVTN